MEKEKIEYSKPEKRTTKHDLKKKRKSWPYKRGGRRRTC